jgi:hypothetical protein
MVRSRSRSAALSSAIGVSLAVSRARSAATMLVSVPGGGGSSGNGHDRAVGVDESQQVLAAVDALAGYPGAAGHAADGDVGVLLTQVAQRFLDPGADGVAAFTGVGGQSVQRGLGDGRNSCG